MFLLFCVGFFLLIVLNKEFFRVMGVGYFIIFLLISWKWILYILFIIFLFLKVINLNFVKNLNNLY